MKLVGYQFTPRETFQEELAAYLRELGRSGGSDEPPLPPSAAAPVFQDEDGRSYVRHVNEEGPSLVPFPPSEPAGTKSPGGRAEDGAANGEDPLATGGFAPADEAPRPPKDPTAAVLVGAIQQLPPQLAMQWLGNAAQHLMLGAGPGGMLDATLATLGLPNPLASGPLSSVLGAAAASAGLGPMGGLLPSLGSELVNGGVPGLASLRPLGGASGLDGLANQISGFAPGGCFPDSQPAGGFDVHAVSAEALDKATDKLLAQWKVDDESSAAEHIAHKAVMDNKQELESAAKELATDPDGFADGLRRRIEQFFSGEAPGSGMPAARMTDPDVTKPEIIKMGVANILVEGLPVARLGDSLTPSEALILEGAATVLSAALPTARLTSKTDSPGVMIENGAASVLVGGATAAIPAPSAPPQADTPANAAPDDPDAPASTGGSSAQEGQVAEPDSGDEGMEDSQAGGSQPDSADEVQPSPMDSEQDTRSEQDSDSEHDGGDLRGNQGSDSAGTGDEPANCNMPTDVAARHQELRETINNSTDITEEERTRLIEEHNEIEKCYEGCGDDTSPVGSPGPVESEDSLTPAPPTPSGPETEIRRDGNKTTTIETHEDGSRSVTVETRHRNQDTDLYVFTVNEHITTVEHRAYDAEGNRVSWRREESAGIRFSQGDDQIGVDIFIHAQSDSEEGAASGGAGVRGGLDTKVGDREVSVDAQAQLGGSVGGERMPVGCDGERCWVDTGEGSLEAGKNPDGGYSAQGGGSGPFRGGVRIGPPPAPESD